MAAAAGEQLFLLPAKGGKAVLFGGRTQYSYASPSGVVPLTIQDPSSGTYCAVLCCAFLQGCTAPIRLYTTGTSSVVHVLCTPLSVDGIFFSFRTVTPAELLSDRFIMHASQR